MTSSTAVEREVENQKVSETIVSAVAELTGSDPVSLEPLYNVVDPDALGMLFNTSGFYPDQSLPRVEFTYCDCDIVVSADRVVQVSQSGQTISKKWV